MVTKAGSIPYTSFPARFPRLRPDEVHVWGIELDPPRPWVARLAATLAPDERERAGRFHNPADRRRFVVAHGAMRQLLGGYLGRNAGAVDFSCGRHGKPFVPGEPVRFNLSRSGERALVAVSLDREVGVDVERIRPMEDARGIAERFFSRAESLKLQTVLGTPAADTAFFTCWTRKEAFVKAIGEGLSHPLATFEVTFLAGEPAELRIAPHPRGQAPRRWTLLDVDPGASYCAALVVEGGAPLLSCWI